MIICFPNSLYSRRVPTRGGPTRKFSPRIHERLVLLVGCTRSSHSHSYTWTMSRLVFKGSLLLLNVSFLLCDGQTCQQGTIQWWCEWSNKCWKYVRKNWRMVWYWEIFKAWFCTLFCRLSTATVFWLIVHRFLHQLCLSVSGSPSRFSSCKRSL